MSESVSISPSPVVPNAWHAFGGIWRLTSRRFLAPSQWLPILGSLALLALITFANVRSGRVEHFLSWTIGFYLTLLVPVMAFLSGAGAMRDEMKSGSVDYVLTRPVRRPAFVVFKYLSHMACTQVVYLIALTVVMALGYARNIPELGAAVPVLILAQALTIAAFTAFGFICAILVSRYLVVGLLYAGIVEVALGRIPTQLNKLAMTNHVKNLLQPIVLDGPQASISAQAVFGATGILLAFSAVMIGVAALCFSLQELTGDQKRES